MEVDTIESLLRRLSMEDDLEAFKFEAIDLEMLKGLCNENLEKVLKQMGLVIGKRIKIVQEIDHMHNEELKKEIRIVLLGKTGCGKSSTGNTILGKKEFVALPSANGVTKECKLQSAFRFGQKVLVVDTPGVFDLEKSNALIQAEIMKCVGLTSPGPHAFILVINVGRFTEEEENSVKHFETYFGEKMFQYFIVLFTRTDDLEDAGKSFESFITNAPRLKLVIAKCGGRFIGFNNRLRGEEGNKQVQKLLQMVSENVEKNNGDCFTNEMYKTAEERIKKRENEIRLALEKKQNEQLQAMRNELASEYAKQIEMHKTQNQRDYEKWKKDFEKEQELKEIAIKNELMLEWRNDAMAVRNAVRREIEADKGSPFGCKIL